MSGKYSLSFLSCRLQTCYQKAEETQYFSLGVSLKHPNPSCTILVKLVRFVYIKVPRQAFPFIVAGSENININFIMTFKLMKDFSHLKYNNQSRYVGFCLISQLCGSFL